MRVEDVPSRFSDTRETGLQLYENEHEDLIKTHGRYMTSLPESIITTHLDALS